MAAVQVEMAAVMRELTFRCSLNEFAADFPKLHHNQCLYHY